MSTTKTTVVLLLSGFAFAACSPPNVTGATSAITSACGDYAYAYCGHLQTCSATALQLRFGDITTCQSVYSALCVAGATAPSTGASAATAQACTKAVPNWVCNDFLFNQNIPPGCRDVTGALPNGTPCAVRQQCQSGYCALAPGAACGVCAPVPQVGASCTNAICPFGLTCLGGVCATFGELGATCSANQPCSEGLNCVLSGPTGTCESGTNTINGDCDFLGAGCDQSSGLVCNAETSTCVTGHLATPTQACGIVANQQAYCFKGSCVRGACVDSIGIGGPCSLTSGAQCLPGVRCIASGTTGTCLVNGSMSCP